MTQYPAKTKKGVFWKCFLFDYRPAMPLSKDYYRKTNIRALLHLGQVIVIYGLDPKYQNSTGVKPNVLVSSPWFIFHCQSAI